MARASFLALPKKERDDAKQVPFFVPACFNTSPSPRTYDHATHCNLIFLDIDPEKEKRDGKWVETGRYPALPFVRDPSSIHKALEGFNFAVHHTASSTPDKPRIRVVVDAEGISLIGYPQAAMTIAALLGLPSITSESKVSVQPMYFPVMFLDSSDDEHPLITHDFGGRTFTPDDSGESSYEIRSSKSAPASSNSLDQLEFLRAPVPEINLAIAKEALHAIDADCSRAEWLNCAAALKHQFAHTQQTEALNLFDEWSSQGTKYGGEEETNAIWKSLRPTPIGRLPVTIRSLLHQAVQSGWNDKRVKESSFSALVRWIDEEAESVIDLLKFGVKKILSAPLLSAVEEDVLIHQISAAAKKRFAYSLTPTAISKELKKLKADIKALEKPAGSIREPLWAKGVCYVAAVQQFYRHRTGEKYRAEAFNCAYARHLLPTEDSLKDAGIPVTPASLSKPIVLPADYALNHLKIATVYDYDYDPSRPTETVFTRAGRRYVNTYSATYPELDPVGAEKAGELLQRHLCVLVSEPDYRTALIDFMAFQVQSPGRKVRWAPMLQSVEGGGKTFLAEAMKAVLGGEHVKTIVGETVKKGWNEWGWGGQLIVLDEVRVAGSNRYEIMNALKPLITNDSFTINQRNRDTREMRNCANYLIFSNHHDALTLSSGDRRYFVIKSPLQTKAQVKALGSEYFPPLYEMLRSFPGALRAFLDDWEISPSFNPDADAPRTKYFSEMVSDSACDLTATVRRLLLEGDHPLIQFDIVSSKSLMDMLQLEDGMSRVSQQQLAQCLRDEGYHQEGRHQIGGEKHYIWARAGLNGASVGIAADRQKRGLKNLCMELLF